MKTQDHKTMHEPKGHADHYKKLLLMTILSYISMFVLMYAMVNRLENVVPNINQFFMAGLMTAPMVIIELALMGSMYMNKKLNAGLIAISAIALIGFYVGIRQQAGVTDKQFLKSMIPHHAGAILMSEKANIQDPEIRELQKNIISSQLAEIAQMKAKLKELEK